MYNTRLTMILTFDLERPHVLAAVRAAVQTMHAEGGLTAAELESALADLATAEEELRRRQRRAGN